MAKSEPAAAPAPSPGDILALATSFQRSRALLTAYELGIFTVLNDEARESAQVAAAIDADPRATDRLMNALAAMGLLEKRAGLFRNTRESGAFLVKGKASYLANLAHSNSLWNTWSGLTEAVRRGRAPARPVGERGNDWLRSFIAAMHWRARQAAPTVVGMLDLDGVSRVLDVGGGSGAYAMAFARARRGITAVVFDLPPVIALTRGYVQEEGLAAAVETVVGDYLADDLGTGYDLVFMSAVIHSNAPDQNRALFAKAAAALRPGGQLVVQDFLVNEDRSGPEQPTLFALNMLVGTESGDTYTEAEVRGWMGSAGFHSITRQDTPVGTNLVVGRR